MVGLDPICRGPEDGRRRAGDFPGRRHRGRNRTGGLALAASRRGYDGRDATAGDERQPDRFANPTKQSSLVLRGRGPPAVLGLHLLQAVRPFRYALKTPITSERERRGFICDCFLSTRDL